MICKTFKGGRTFQGAKATVKYLLNERVKSGEARVLRGSSDMTLAYIKQASKKQKWSWSSGVLSFAETLTEEQKRQVIEEFERVFFPGLDRDQYDLLVVEHSDKGRTELHYIAPRIELSSGLAFNPYFVNRDLKKKDLFQDYVNLLYGFSQWQNTKSVTKVKPKWSENAKKKDIRKSIDDALLPLIESNIIENRADLILQLEEWGFGLNRTGKDSITIIDESGKKHRLKGSIYSEEFEDGIRGIEEKIRRDKETTRARVSRDVQSVREELDRIVEHQAQTNRKRYARRDRAKQKEIRYDEKTARANTQEIKQREPDNTHNKQDKGRINNDRNRAKTIDRIRASRERARRRKRASAARVSSYTRAAKSDYQTFRKRRGERKFRRAAKASNFRAVERIFAEAEREVDKIIEAAEKRWKAAEEAKKKQPEIKSTLVDSSVEATLNHLKR